MGRDTLEDFSEMDYQVLVHKVKSNDPEYKSPIGLDPHVPFGAHGLNIYNFLDEFKLLGRDGLVTEEGHRVMGEFERKYASGNK